MECNVHYYKKRRLIIILDDAFILFIPFLVEILESNNLLLTIIALAKFVHMTYLLL